ncbi:MAG: prepilin-type N-terminal cleavage/methylation domain-containing protein [Myxococcales bacterium]|nr:prepilin-type N-terminal cleavage/methylation domain-containing protein [Myxococcales bacterium]
MPRRRSSEAGFTLMELMIVVAIVGILAAIAIPTFTAYVQKSRTTEATTFLAEIKQRQEAYRAEFNQYADVMNPQPSTIPRGGQQIGWDPTQAEWQQLGAAADNAVRFQYDTFAGLPSQAVSGGLAGCGGGAGTGVDNTEFWFVAQAVGDLDGDGVPVCFEVTSHRGLWVSHVAGWE